MLQVVFSLQPSEGSHIQVCVTGSGCSCEMSKSNCTESISDPGMLTAYRQRVYTVNKISLKAVYYIYFEQQCRMICLEYHGDPSKVGIFLLLGGVLVQIKIINTALNIRNVN